MSDEAEDDIEVVDFQNAGVIRCKRCRTYINPFVAWVDNGRRWRCNLCGAGNDVPSSYFCHLKADNTRQDTEDRPELRSGSVEIVAPAEYMMRPPQPPVFVFVIDVSNTAVMSGMLQCCVETIRDKLDSFLGQPCTKVGFITFDSSVHFYNLKASLKAPQLMVVPDISELFIPIPDDLLVNLNDSREIIDMLLEMLPNIHAENHTLETALGPAIRAAFRVMSSIGGKMLVFQTTLPSVGQGQLRHRENPRAFGTEKETSFLNSIDTFYRQNAIEFSRQQVAVDLFLFSSQYTDVATLGTISKFSAGQLYYYPGFSVEKDGEKFKSELNHCLSRDSGWEAVMRVRCTQGMRLSNFYGNSFMRGADLLALPNVNSDSTFAIELTHSDALLNTSIVSVQAALLYTTSSGQRRIRVHTMAAPITKLYAEIFRSVDVDALCNIMAKNALENALKSGLEHSRQKLQNQCCDIVRAYRTAGAYGMQAGGQQNSQVNLPEALQLLPLYVMALMKNPVLRGGSDVKSDERTFLMYELNNMTVTQSARFIYPRLLALDIMSPECGHPLVKQNDENEQNLAMNPSTVGFNAIVVPAQISLSVERLRSDGIFLLEDSRSMFMWVGRAIAPQLCMALFGFPTLEGIDSKSLTLINPPVDEFAVRVQAILNGIREDKKPFLQLTLLVEGDPAEAKFFWKLVEDRASFNGGSSSYSEFLGQVSRQSQARANPSS